MLTVQQIGNEKGGEDIGGLPERSLASARLDIRTTSTAPATLSKYSHHLCFSILVLMLCSWSRSRCQVKLQFPKVQLQFQ